MTKNIDPEKIVREIKRKTRRKISAEEKIRIVLEGLRGEETITELCRREGISPNLYYILSKEPGKRFQSAGDLRNSLKEIQLPAIQEILDANASDSSVGNWKAKGRSLKLRPFLFERAGV